MGGQIVDDVEGARTFSVAGEVYDRFMGRYSTELAQPFIDAAGVQRGHTALDVGCGPGALTTQLIALLGAGSVDACDPAPGFVDECAARHPDIDVVLARAESLPYDDDRFDHAMAQLVLHFVSDPVQAGREMIRVVQPGGTVSACVWDFEHEMEMLRAFWNAANAIDSNARDEARTLRFGRVGELAELLAGAGLIDVTESTLTVSSSYESFDELWQGFLGGVGPAGAYCVGLDDQRRRLLRDELFKQVGSPTAGFSLSAGARCATGTKP